MKFARRSVSDADIRKYQAFAQTLQQVGLGVRRTLQRGHVLGVASQRGRRGVGQAFAQQALQQVGCRRRAAHGLASQRGCGLLQKSLPLPLSLPSPPVAPQSRGFGSEFRFPDQVGALSLEGPCIFAVGWGCLSSRLCGAPHAAGVAAHPRRAACSPPPCRAAPRRPRRPAPRPPRRRAPLHLRARLTRTTTSTADLQLTSRQLSAPLEAGQPSPPAGQPAPAAGPPQPGPAAGPGALLCTTAAPRCLFPVLCPASRLSL